jgi:hypothetical protein
MAPPDQTVPELAMKTSRRPLKVLTMESTAEVTASAEVTFTL